MLDEQRDFLVTELRRGRLIFLGSDAVVLHHRSEYYQCRSRGPSLQLPSTAEHLVECREVEGRRNQCFLRRGRRKREAAAALYNRRARQCHHCVAFLQISQLEPAKSVRD